MPPARSGAGSSVSLAPLVPGEGVTYPGRRTWFSVKAFRKAPHRLAQKLVSSVRPDPVPLPSPHRYCAELSGW